MPRIGGDRGQPRCLLRQATASGGGPGESLASGPSQRHSLPAHQHPQAGTPGAYRRGALSTQWPAQSLPADGGQTLHRAGSGSRRGGGPAGAPGAGGSGSGPAELAGAPLMAPAPNGVATLGTGGGGRDRVAGRWPHVR